MKMHDLGEKCGGEQPMGKNEKYYTSLKIPVKVGAKDIGDEIELKVIAKIKNIDEYGTNVELKKCGVKNIKDYAEYNEMSDEDKDKSDEDEVMSR